MPEGYTHVRTGQRALIRSGLSVSNKFAFGAGANGPDPLFFYKAWNKEKNKELADLAHMMHEEKTGAFLLGLAKQADTPTKKSYVMGFYTHYAVDKAAHPYVDFLTQKGGVYDIPKGHHYYESELGSALHYLDYRDTLIPANHVLPLPDTAKLRQIGELLQGCIKEVYGKKYEVDMLIDCFKHMRLVKNVLQSRTGFLKKGFGVLEKAVLHNEGFLLSITTPVHTKLVPPDKWIDKFDNNKPHTGGMKQILYRSELESAKLLKALISFWEKTITGEELQQKVGNKSYTTGQEI